MVAASRETRTGGAKTRGGGGGGATPDGGCIDAMYTLLTRTWPRAARRASDYLGVASKERLLCTWGFDGWQGAESREHTMRGSPLRVGGAGV